MGAALGGLQISVRRLIRRAIDSAIGRITDFKADNPVVRSRFVNDLDAMGALYGGESVAVP